jgi:flavodoxin I
MKKAVVLYWPKGGNTENVAKNIAAAFNDKADIFDIKSFKVNDIDNYDLIITGASTIGAENWIDASNDNEWSRFGNEMRNKDFSGKYVAFFGLGDQVLYPNHFVDVLGVFEKEFAKTDAKIIGRWSTDGYRFTDSEGEKDGMFYGLAIDEDNESEKTYNKIKIWVEQLLNEMK